MDIYDALTICLIGPLVVALIVAVSLVPPFCFLTLYVYCMVAGWQGEVVFKRQMARASRSLSRRDRRRIDQEEGTLIFDSFTLGWGIVRVWWTPEKVSEMQPPPLPTTDEWRAAATEANVTPWDRWCWNNFISPVTGRALLLRTGGWFQFWTLPALKRRYAQIPQVSTWSVEAQAQCRSAPDKLTPAENPPPAV